MIHLNQQDKNSRKRRASTFTALFFLLAAMLACNQPVQTNQSAAEASSQNINSTNSNILFADDFSQPESGWDRVGDNTITTNYQDGSYHIQINQTNLYGWANPRKVFSDVEVEVNAELKTGPIDAEYGAICRYKDAKNFYAGIITADGYYGVIKSKDGKFSLVGMEYLQDHPVIRQGTTSNQIRFDCIGDTLTLYANNEILAQVKDSDFANGDVGLLASTNSSPGADVYFDNFFVYRP